jgi:hypothetical protein
VRKLIIIFFLSSALIFFISDSCKEFEEYFHVPETESITDALKTSAIIGYSVSTAMSVMEGHHLSNVRIKTVCSGYPCVSVMLIRIDDTYPFSFAPGEAGEVIVAGLWADEGTAILTLLLTDFNIHTSTFRLKNIHTIPVIRTFDGKITVAFAGMDINLNQQSDDLLEFNLLTQEIESEFARLDNPLPADEYIAVKQNAWVIEIDQKNTPDDLWDDSFTITGGGQLAEVAGNTAEVIQQGMVDVILDQICPLNPVYGHALIRKINTEDSRFPELGTAILEFHDNCDGKAEVLLATGAYIGSNGKSIRLDMDD